MQNDRFTELALESLFTDDEQQKEAIFQEICKLEADRIKEEHILEQIKDLIPERELEYYKALSTAKDDEKKKKIIISQAEKLGIGLVPGELEIYIKNATPEKILHQILDIAFNNATDPQMIISLGNKLGMSFTQKKAEEIAERHKYFKGCRASELTEEEVEKLSMDYWLGGAWKDIIPQDKEKYAESTITDRDIMEHAVDLFIDALPNLNEINSLPKEAPDDDRGTKKDVFTSLKGKD